jgi:hypothetical protein
MRSRNGEAEAVKGGRDGGIGNIDSRIHTSLPIQIDTMMRCLLLSTITDHRGRFDIDWSSIVEEASKSGPGGDCGFERRSEGGRDGGQGPSLGLEDGTSKDGRAKRHLDVSSAERIKGARTLAMAVLDPEVCNQGVSVYGQDSWYWEVK